MKRLFLTIVVLLSFYIPGLAHALTSDTISVLCIDKDTSCNSADSTRRPLLLAGNWKSNSTPALKLDEVNYTNWAATGNSYISFVGTFNGTYKYTHERYTWDNVIDLALGINWLDLMGNDSSRIFDTRRKNDDKIDITSTFSMKMKKAWNINAAANFKTQFLEGLSYATTTDTGTLVSSFMAPAYLTTSVGFELKKDAWNLALSFLTGKTTFLLDEEMVSLGRLYGVDTANGKRVYAGLGSYIKFYFKKDVAKNLNIYTRVELFYDYRKPHYHDCTADFGWPDYVVRYGYDKQFMKRTLYCLSHDTDVDVEFKLEYRLSNFLSFYCAARFKYDSDFTGHARILGIDDSNWQMYQGAGLQLFFNWKTPKKV